MSALFLTNAFFEFIKTYIYQIIIVIVVAVILVLILISLLKKPKESKNANFYDKSLALQKEREGKKSVKVYSNRWVIYRKDIQEYYVYLYDEKKNEILRSEMYASILGAQKDIDNLAEAIREEHYKITHDIDGAPYCLFKSGRGRLMATTPAFQSIKDLEDGIRLLKETCDKAVREEGIVRDLSLSAYSKENKIALNKKSDGWKIDSMDGQCIGRLMDENGKVLLVTEEYPKKKEVKELIGTFKTAVSLGDFVVDLDRNNQFYFRLRNSSKLTLARGRSFETLDACMEAIQEVIKNA